LVLVWASGQNIDRLVTLYKACRKARRQLILDLYTLHIIRATGNERIPDEGWSSMRVFVPLSQRLRIKRDGRFDLINPLKPYRIFPEQLPEVENRSVMLFRPSMIRDLDRIEGLNVGRLICSVWRGYLDDERNKPLLDWLRKCHIPLDHCHTSGHAPASDLKRLREAFGEAVVVPVHTRHGGDFESAFGRCRCFADGDWQQVE
jgi:ribonuclease J